MQNRLRNYQNAILSFQHNVFNLGMHSTGRYMGFDTINKIGGLQFYLGHSGSNLEYTDPNSTPYGPIGVFLTPQGTIIMEDANIGPFQVDGNGGNAEYRYDLIYAQHDQVELSGGQDATYYLIKGPMNNPIRPQMPDHTRNTIIGYVRIPPGELADINNCTWLKQRCPDSGDGPDARLDSVNIFSQYQGMGLSQKIYTNPTVVDLGSNNFWQLENDGNEFRIYPTTPISLDAILVRDVIPTEGNRIHLLINENVKLYETSIVVDSDLIAKGYRGFTIRPQFFDAPLIGGFPVLRPSLNPNVGEIWEVTAIYMDSAWVVTNIGGKRPLIPTAPNTAPYDDNISSIVPGLTSNAFGIYTKPAAAKYPILFSATYHIGDLQDPGLDYAISFGMDLGTTNYIVLGTLSANAAGNNNNNTTGVWALMSQSSTGIVVHVNEYAHSLSQDLNFTFVIMRIG